MVKTKQFTFSARKLYDLACDLINIVEENYSEKEMKEAYKNALKICKKLEKLTENQFNNILKIDRRKI